MLKRAGSAPSQHFQRAKLFISRPSIRCLPSSALARRPLLRRSSLIGQNHSACVDEPLVVQTPNPLVPNHTPAKLLCSLLSESSTDRLLIRRIRAAPSLLSHLLDPTKARLLAEAVAVAPATSHRAIQVLRLAHLLGCQMKQNAYECIAYQLARVSKWNQVLAVVSSGKRHTAKTTVRLLNWRIRALIETDQHLQLQSMLEEFTHYHVKPSRRTFHLLISGHIRNRDLVGVQNILRIMKQHGVNPDESTTATIAIYHRAFGPNAQVQERSLKILPTLDGITSTVVLNSLIELRLDAQDLIGSLDLLMLFDSSQVTPIVQVITGVISTQGDGGLQKPSSPISRSLSVPPNAETFTIFIRYLASRDWTATLRVLECLLSLDIKPTPEVVVSLIHALFQANESSVAIQMVAKMCNSEQCPPEMLQPLGPIDPDLQLPLNVSDIRPTTRVFNALLKGVLPIRGLDVVPDVIDIMQANGLQPNSGTVEVLIAYLRNVGASPGTIGRMIRRLFPTVRPSIRHLHILLNVILRHERFLTFGSGWDSFAAHFSRVRQDRPRHPKKTHSSDGGYVSIGGVVLRRADNRVVKFIVQDLLSRGVNVDSVVAGLRLRQEAGVKLNVDNAEAVLQAILARGIQPNEYHFGALMEGYTRTGDLKTASELLRRAVHIGIKPNVVLFTILIAGHARQGDPDNAVRVFQQMVANKIQPDRAAIDAVSSAFFAVGSYGMARHSLVSLWPYVMPFPKEFRSLRLRQLAVAFRGTQATPKTLSKKEWVALYRKLTHLILRWRASLEPKQNKR